jgi:hypothetical protein
MSNLYSLQESVFLDWDSPLTAWYGPVTLDYLRKNGSLLVFLPTVPA